MAEATLDTHGIVYGSQNMILAWHNEMETPKLVAIRGENPFKDHVTTITPYGSGFLDAGYYDEVYLTNVNSIIQESRGSEAFIMGLAPFNNRCMVFEHERDVWSPDNCEGMVPGIEAWLMSLSKEPETMLKLGDHRDLWTWTDLDYRPGSLTVVEALDKLWVSSQNIISIDSKLNITKHTDYMSDFVTLVTNGDAMYSLSSGNETTHKGVEIRTVPDNECVAYWLAAKKDQKEGEARPVMNVGYPNFATMIGNTLIFGAGNSFKGLFPIYQVEVDPEMRDEQVLPEPLIEGAFAAGRYGHGNPICAATKGSIERLITSTRKPE